MSHNLVTQYNDCIRRIEFYREHKNGSQFDDFYHSHLDFMQESLEYRLKHETIMEIETKEVCPHCKKILNYKILKDKRSAEKYGYYKESLDLRIAVCINCGEELNIPSIEAFNEKLIAPYLEKQEKERDFEICIPSLLDSEELDVVVTEEKIVPTPEKKSLMNGWDNPEVYNAIFNAENETKGYAPTNPHIFEGLLQQGKDSLIYSDAFAKIIESEKTNLYSLLKENVTYVKSFTKFPMYMIKEMIEINPEVVLYLRDAEFEVILLGIEYAKKHYYGKELSAIVKTLSTDRKLNIMMHDIYGENWADNFLDPISHPERLNQSQEGK